MPARRSAIRSTRRGSTCAAACRASAPTASRSRCATSTRPTCARLLDAAGVDGAVDVARVPPLRLGAQALPFPRRQRRGRTDEPAHDRWLHTPPRKSATFDDARDRRNPPRGRDRHLRHPRRRREAQAAAFRRSAVPRRLDQPLSARRLSREVRAPTSTLGTRFAKKPITLKIPITIAGMSFGSLSAQAKEALGRGATRGRHLDHDRRRRHDAGGARAFQHARLPGAALALRHEPGRSAQGRRHRGRGRPGRQARRRRHAAGPEDLRARRRDAHAARRASTSARPAGIPTGPARTISRSRSRSCARSPTGRSRST